MDYKKAAEARKSIREFTDRPIAQEQKQALEQYFSECRRLVPEISVEFMIIEGDRRSCLDGNAGYEGLTFDAPAYLLLLSEVKPGYLENAGYMNEDMILHMTDMGLDSCWLTVDDDAALRVALDIRSEKKVAAITAFGHGKKERSLTRLHIKSFSNVEVVTREGHVAPKITLSEMVYSDAWGKEAELDEMYMDDGLRNALYAASYAPTFLNRQSFRFLLADGKAILVKMMDSMTGELDGKLNCGAVMLNFAAVLDERRPFATKWTLGGVEGIALPADCEIVGFCSL